MAGPSPRMNEISLTVLAVLATLWALQWAKPVLIPVLMGVLLSYAVDPVVTVLERWRVPRMAGGGLVIVMLVSLTGWGAWTLSDQADDLLGTLPPVTAKLRELMQGKTSAESTLKKVERAVAEIEAAAMSQPRPAAPGASAAGGSASAPGTNAGPGRSAPAAGQSSKSAAEAGIIAPSRIDLRAYLLSGSVGVLIFLGQLVAIAFIALFLVASGTSFRRKMVRISGPRLSQKKVTIETLNEINEQIQRYLLLQVGTSVLVGLATWLTFYALGLKQAAVWGVIAAVTNLIPYLGAVFVGVGASAVAFVQFGTLEMALLVCVSSFVIRTLNGQLLGPWLMGKATRMNPVVVFITVLLFGWLWGAWGLILGVPILMVIKTICDRVESLQMVGELLSE